MKTTIRNGVFETNSSSVHAIVVNRGSKRYIPKAVEFTLGCFGWEEENYTTVDEKASYLWTAICELKTLTPELLENLRRTLQDAGVSTVSFENPKKESPWAYYIDHSYDLSKFVEALLGDQELLLDYLFGESEVVTGNDNSDESMPKFTIPDSKGKEWTYWKGN